MLVGSSSPQPSVTSCDAATLTVPVRYSGEIIHGPVAGRKSRDEGFATWLFFVGMPAIARLNVREPLAEGAPWRMGSSSDRMGL